MNFIQQTGMQRQELAQHQKISTEMKQSLDILQMPFQDLHNHVNQIKNENPFLEIESAEETSRFFGTVPIPHQQDDASFQKSHSDPARQEPNENYYHSLNKGYSDSISFLPELMYKHHEEDFVKNLNEQLAFLPLDTKQYHTCLYLIECLNQRGYLEFDIGDLAKELHISRFEATQALYVIQSLTPKGVGARSLQECLLLQLVDTQDFNAYTVRIIKDGLHLLAKKNMQGLAKLLQTSLAVAVKNANAVQALTPIPSRGYNTNNETSYIIPDVVIYMDNNQLKAVLNKGGTGGLELNREYCEMLQSCNDKETKKYLKEKFDDAKHLIRWVAERHLTLERITHCIMQLQPSFFADGHSLKPMKLSDVASILSLHPSTISRAIKDKYIKCKAGTVSFKSLFSATIYKSSGAAVSSALAQRLIKQWIDSEDKKSPLTDESLRLALEETDISIARRTVAKYREELGYEKSTQRKSL